MREGVLALSIRDERGAFTIEFVASFILFMLFFSGLSGVTLWGTGNAFVREAAFEAARKYAVYVDQSRAEEAARVVIQNGGYVFVDSRTLRVRVWREGDSAVAEVAAKPRVDNLFGFYKMPELRRMARCTLEYRFRTPGEFTGI